MCDLLVGMSLGVLLRASASQPKGAKKTIEEVISLEYRHHGPNGAIDVLEKRHSRSIVVLKLALNPRQLF